MRRLTNRLTICMIGMMLCITAGHSFAMEDGIIAIVNDEIITFQDLRSYIRSTYISMVGRGLPDDELKDIMKDLEVNGIHKLIDDKIILSKANEMGFEINERYVDEEIESIQEKYGSEQALVEALIQNGASITDMRNKIRNQLKIKYTIDTEVRSKIIVNPQEITDYYEQNIETFKKNERVSLNSIFIAFNNNMTLAKAKAQEVQKKLNDNVEFSELIKEYSDTPSIGIVEKGQLMPEIEEIVFNLKKNEITEPIEVDTGIYIFQLKGKAPEETASLEEVKSNISKYLLKKKFRTRFGKWLEELKNDAYIEIKQ